MSYHDLENQKLLQRGVEALEMIAKTLSESRRSNLVHCSECCNYIPESLHSDDMMCAVSGRLTNPDDFCSRGCRRSLYPKH